MFGARTELVDPGAPVGVEVVEPTLTPDETAEGSGTPAPEAEPEVDASAVQFQQAVQTVAKLQDDINRLKATSQQRYDLLVKDVQTREDELLDRLAAYDTADMDDAARAQYTANRSAEKMQRREQAIQQREALLQQRELQGLWDGFFTQKIGLQPSVLIRDQGFQEFYLSGWNAVEGLVGQQKGRIGQLEGALRAAKLPVPPGTLPTTPRIAGPKTPPKVRTDVPQSTAPGKRLADIPPEKLEAYFKLVEDGKVRPQDVPLG